MKATLVVVDTNQIVGSPLLKSRSWQQLLDRAEPWNLKIVVPEVCVREAIAKVRDRWKALRNEIDKHNLDELSLGRQKSQLLAEIDSQIQGYEAALRARLRRIGADIVAVPNSVEILDIVQRAIDRRAPYSESKKDGFRDTLIWYTTRSIAVANPNSELWFVSDNVSDFGDQSQRKSSQECPYPFHPHLVAELEADELSGRVSYVTSVARLQVHLVSTYDGLTPADRDALVDRVDWELFEARLLHALVGRIVDSRIAALPVTTRQGIIYGCAGDAESRELVDVGMRPGGVWSAQFKEQIEATVALIDANGNTSSIEKALIVGGRFEAGTDGSIKELTVASVEALPEDPLPYLHYQPRLTAEDFTMDWENPIPAMKPPPREIDWDFDD